MLAGIVSFLIAILMLRLRIDDPLDAVAVHMGGGCLGVICVPFFQPPDTGRLISNHVFVSSKKLMKKFKSSSLKIE